MTKNESNWQIPEQHQVAGEGRDLHLKAAADRPSQNVKKMPGFPEEALRAGNTFLAATEPPKRPLVRIWPPQSERGHPGSVMFPL